jgi:hypothetical protein
MERGQASIEYTLLIAILIVSLCLLVRYQSPVIAIARSVQHAVAAHHRPDHRGHAGHAGHHRSPVHKPCWCAPAGTVG